MAATTTTTNEVNRVGECVETAVSGQVWQIPVKAGNRRGQRTDDRELIYIDDDDERWCSLSFSLSLSLLMLLAHQLVPFRFTRELNDGRWWTWRGEGGGD